MTLLSLPAGQLLAAYADADANGDNSRVVEGILVPWGEAGRTNLGRKVVRRGAVRLEAGAKVVGIYGHDRERAVSRLLASEDRPEGLWGRLRVGRGPLGDQLLAEVTDGVRDGLSVELDDLELDPATGDVLAGRLDFVAHVPVGAYSSALAAAMAAQLHTPNPGEPVTQPTPAALEPATPPAPAPALSPEQFTQLLAQLQAGVHVAAPAGDTLTAASVPGGLMTNGVQTAPPADTADPVLELARLQAGLFQGGQNSPRLQAALADITNSGLDIFQNPAGAIGEKLWEGAGYTRRFVPLMRSKPLTSWKFRSWQWVGGPKMAPYAGDKAEIPTNTWTVEEFEHEASRIAGGWDIDRKFRDFSDAEFWAELYRQQTESYLEETDAEAAAFLVASARSITSDANVPAEYVGSNVAQADVLRATALGTAILEDTPRVRRGPDFVLMNTADWLNLMDLTNLDLPAFLALLKVDPGNFQRTSEVPAGRVVLGITQGSTFRELGGAAPIRVEALDVARAGIDSAVYGYTGLSHDRPGSIISVPLVAEEP